jgi:rhodanese-related sulfurtransferase
MPVTLTTAMTRRALLGAALSFQGLVAAMAQTPSPLLSAREAYDASRTGRLLLVDIRTQAEWADTGVPQGAIRLDADSSGFEVRLAGLRLDNPGKRIALIDRTGGLSASVRQKLSQRGWRDLVVVRGGMLGEAGWLAERLPVEPVR